MTTFEEIDAAALSQRMSGPSPPVLVDVREDSERLAAYIEPSHHIPIGDLPSRITNELPDPLTPLVLYCAHGYRSGDACVLLRGLGYREVLSLAGGIEAWAEAGLPVKVPHHADGAEWSPRYARQVKIPELGPAGQRRLLDARVLIIGAGGLGSPAAIYLAAAGIGKIGLVDFDSVSQSNLHRQILYRTSDVGTPKVHTARAALQAQNRDVEIVPYLERLTTANAERIVREYDVVIDGTDNLATRYLVNDVCLMLNRPNVHGAVFRFEGQVAVFCHSDGPCYRCLYPAPPPPEQVPSCAEAGVLGLLPGIVGTLQATEAIKLVLGLGRPLAGRMVRYDALDGTFQTFEVPRRPDCGWCAPNREFPGLGDYDAFCEAR